MSYPVRCKTPSLRASRKSGTKLEKSAHLPQKYSRPQTWKADNDDLENMLSRSSVWNDRLVCQTAG